MPSSKKWLTNIFIYCIIITFYLFFSIRSFVLINSYIAPSYFFYLIQNIIFHLSFFFSFYLFLFFLLYFSITFSSSYFFFILFPSFLILPPLFLSHCSLILYFGCLFLLLHYFFLHIVFTVDTVKFYSHISNIYTPVHFLLI